MSDAKKIALNRAEILLKAAGVSYAIKLEDGSVLGTLALAPISTKSPFKKINNFVREHDYINAMKKLKPGELLSWSTGTREKTISFQKVVSGTGSRLWGTGSFITTQTNDGTCVELLRVC